MAKWNPDDFQKDHNKQEDKKFSWSFGYGEDASKQESAGQSAQDSAGKSEDKAKFSGSADKQDKSKKKPGKPGKSLGILIALAIIIFMIFNCFYILPEGQVAYVTQFGKIVSTSRDAGLKFKLPFVQDINFLTDKIMYYDVNPSEVLTADKKAMIVDSYVLWKIDDAPTFIRTVGGNTEEMQKRIDASVYSNIKNIMGRLQQSEIITADESSRDSLNQQVTRFAGKELSNYGVEVLRVEIRRFDLPKDNLSAVYDRMISERQQMAVAFKADGDYEAAKMRNETDKEYDIMIGEAKAEARRIQGQAEEEYMAVLKEIYGDKDRADFYRFTLELDALEQSLQGEKTVILGPDSFLAQMLSDGGIDSAAQENTQEKQK